MHIPNVAADAIISFYGDFEFLSNFHPSALVVDNEFYKTVEHAFQAAKTDDPDAKKDIRESPTPKDAKRKGRSVTLVPDWDLKKVDVMHALVHQKFNAHVDLKIRLLMTGQRDLIEGNTWKDTFWGVTKDGVGENHLGKILVAVRDEIRRAEGTALDVLLAFLTEKGLGMVTDDLKTVLNFSEKISTWSETDDFPYNDQDSVQEVFRKLK